MAGPLGRAPHQRARPRRRRAAVLQPHDVPLPVGRGAARGEHVRLHRQRHLRPVQAAAGVRRLRAHRLRRVRHPQRELRDQAGHQPRRADPAEHRELPPPAPPHRRHVRLAPRAVAPPIRRTTSGPSGSSSSCSRRGRPTRRRPRSTGAPRTRPCWPTSRSSTAAASAATRWWSSGRWSSGSSGSPTTPTGCWPTWTTRRRWTGRTRTDHGAAQLARPLGGRGARVPHRPARRQADGDAGRRPSSASSPPGPTPSSAPPSWCSPPSTRWWTRLVSAEQRAAVEAYRKAAASQDLVSRKVGEREKTGVFTGGYAINPATGKQIPVWIADYVLMEYGTGAIMAVPGHDERDFEFAAEVRPADRPRGRRRAGERTPAQATPTRTSAATSTTSSGVLVNSGQFDGLTVPEAKRAITAWLASAGRGQGASSTTACTTGASPASATGARRSPSSTATSTAPCRCRRRTCRSLLPLIDDFKPDDTGISPLARHEELVPRPVPDVRQAGPARDRRERHLPRLGVVPPALPEHRVRRPPVRPGAHEEVVAVVGGDLHHRPVYSGGRFWTNERMPSLKSSLRTASSS